LDAIVVLIAAHFARPSHGRLSISRSLIGSSIGTVAVGLNNARLVLGPCQNVTLGVTAAHCVGCDLI
jgi:hypothetical protein